jgi:serine beta-lactamase-like protein LACTB, mitochondrial
MRTTRRATLLSLLALPGSAPIPGVTATKVKQLQAFLRAKAVKEKLPAISVAVNIGGRMVLSEGIGMADLENRVSASSQSVYRLCSISKALTTVAALQLAETRRLDLDAPIRTYLPEAPQTWWTISARQLICHTSGIRHYRDDAEVHQTKHYERLEDALELFRDDPLLFNPGTSVQYSTFGYTLLGVVMERASGEPFRDYMHKHVFKPAAMGSTRDDDVSALVPNRVRGYRIGPDGRHLNCHLEDPSYKVPGGGMLATAEDVARFALAVRSGKLLGAEMVRQLFTRHAGPKERNLGWDVDEHNGLRIVGHTGGGEGFITDFRMLPDSGIIAVVLGNNEDSRLNARDIIGMLT